MSRPEDSLPPDLYYNDSTSASYTHSTRIRRIQASMTHRALSLLALPPDQPSFILDVGCGSGLSGQILSDEGHVWAGLDVSPSMLDIALQRQQARFEHGSNDGSSDSGTEDGVPGDLFLADMGQGLPFRPGTFDACISISALQWLCAAPGSSDAAMPEKRLRCFFDGLYACLKRGARSVLQFYPKNDAQRTMITSAAVRAGFGAGLLVDEEGTKNEKIYLVLSVGGGDITEVVGGLDDREEVNVEDGRGLRDVRRKRGSIDVKGSKAWVMKKKERMKGKGMVVKSDSKYTGRKRGPKF